MLRFVLRVCFVPLFAFAFLFDVVLVNILFHVRDAGGVGFGFFGEPGVPDGVCGGDALGRVDAQALLDEVEAVLVDDLPQLLGLGLDVPELVPEFGGEVVALRLLRHRAVLAHELGVVGQPHDVGPLLLEVAQDHVHFGLQLLLRLLAEQRLPQHDFGYQAARTPDVDFEFVPAHAQQQLWTPLPQRHYFLGLVLFDVGPQVPSKPKICKFDTIVHPDQQI